MTEENIYVGAGKSNQYGSRINVCLNDLFEYAKDNIEPAKNGKKYIKLDVGNRRQSDNYGNDLFVKINTWKPKQQSSQPVQEQTMDKAPF